MELNLTLSITTMPKKTEKHKNGFGCVNAFPHWARNGSTTTTTMLHYRWQTNKTHEGKADWMMYKRDELQSLWGLTTANMSKPVWGLQGSESTWLHFKMFCCSILNGTADYLWFIFVCMVIPFGSTVLNMFHWPVCLTEVKVIRLIVGWGGFTKVNWIVPAAWRFFVDGW